MPPSAAYLDPATGATYPIETPRWRSETGDPLMITDLPGIGRGEIDTGQRSLWRYAAALPVAVADPVTLGEGCTPLVRRPWRGGHAHFKLEWFAPSGSFKDRGASVMLSILRQQGIDAVLEDSSGNGGAAVATYAAAAGMRAKILVPASTSPAKTVQMRAVGAEVELVPGTRQDTADAAVAQADSIFYASHNWQAHFLQGTKTLAYELWEDLGFAAPDHVIIPCGAGSNILGCDIGFSELLRRGAIARLPRLHAVQPAHCAPLHAGFEAGAADFVPVTPRDPDDALWHSLQADGPANAAAGILGIQRIGDCKAPGLIAHAVYDGHRAARRIDGDRADGEDLPEEPPFRRDRVVISAML